MNGSESRAKLRRRVLRLERIVRAYRGASDGAVLALRAGTTPEAVMVLIKRAMRVHEREKRRRDQ